MPGAPRPALRAKPGNALYRADRRLSFSLPEPAQDPVRKFFQAHRFRSPCRLQSSGDEGQAGRPSADQTTEQTARSAGQGRGTHFAQGPQIPKTPVDVGNAVRLWAKELRTLCATALRCRLRPKDRFREKAKGQTGSLCAPWRTPGTRT